MKIKIKNLGAIRKAEFTLGDLTVICGGNNTGKTYATYALFGFLTYWRAVISIRIPDDLIQSLQNEGSVELDIRDYIDATKTLLEEGCKKYTKQLFHIFGSSEKHFIDSYFSVDLEKSKVEPASEFNHTMGTAKKQLFSITKKSDSSTVTISLLVGLENINISQHIISEIIGDAIKEMMFGHLFPHPFISSAERTGAAIFRKELNFARNRLLEEMSAMEKEINPYELLSKVFSDYALPVKSNVDFTRKLEEIVKKESFILKEHPEILNDFQDIIGGEYVVTKNDELYFVPKEGPKTKLTMDESSSAVRSLLDVGFYLRHEADRGHILMIDEPELNLHPENQRRIARLFSKLVNLGIKVFISTHSDYLIKELNTLIMLNQNIERLKKLADIEGYSDSELLNPDKVKVYVAEEDLILLDGRIRKSRCLTLKQANIDESYGIEVSSFDSTIEDMNRIQEEIVWGANEP